MTMRYSMCILVLFAECHQHSDCHHCSNHQKPFCSQRQCHCRECIEHSQCWHYCGSNQSPYCSTDGHCQCVAIVPQGTKCHNHIDCSHHCNAYQSFYCSLGSCHCGDVDCQHDSQCIHHCRAGETHICTRGRCSCIVYSTTTTTTTTTTSPTTPTTTPTTPTTTPTTTTTTTTTEAPTTTPDPTTVDAQLLIKCSNHTGCSSHVCPAGKHPYCSFSQRSSDCQCTVCTDDSHCFCPAGLVGKCHFNYFDRSYSCVCGIASDTTTQPKETTTVPPTTAQHEATSTQQTTSSLGIRSCHICGDNDNGIPCDTRSIYTGNLQQCGPGEDFCMMDLIHNGQPFPTIFKRCVTEEECRNKWLHQTSDLEHCTNYGNVLVEGHYSCHFCCTSDGCNSNQIPEKSTLYIKA
eukprot:XP_019929484.1 PREDICTED: integumentary mucin C.1-like isoform X2 [Crassostrea gigas]